MRAIIAVPATLTLIVRAYTRKSLTIPGIITAALTAAVHAVHPSPIPFTLLVVFFLLGTTATKVKHEIKSTLTISSTGSSGGEGPRSTIQVLANSGVASLLVLLHVFNFGTGHAYNGVSYCFGGVSLKGTTTIDILLLGIIANYAAVTADTLSSELGILSRSKPRLVTSPWKVVPPGTNGGVTIAGLASGTAGSFIIGLMSIILLPFCDNSGSTLVHIQMVGHTKPQIWHLSAKLVLLLAITLCGTLGSVLDSILGALVQASVVDTRTGKVVEGSGGSKVLTTKPRRKRIEPGGSGGSSSNISNSNFTPETQSEPDIINPNSSSQQQGGREVNSGRDLLDNNQVNVLMALLMSLGAMFVATYFLRPDGSSTVLR